VRRALLLLVVLAAVVAVAAFDVPSDAATVNGVGISRATLDADLGVIQAAPTYQCYLAASLALQSQDLAMLPAIGGAGIAKTVNTRFADFWLDQLVDNELIAQLAAARHLPVTPADLAAGRTDLVNSISATLTEVAQASGQSGACAPDGTSILSAVPPAFAARLVASQAAGDVVLAAAAGYGLSPAELASFYSGHRSQFDTLCVSAIETASEAAATAARAEIEAGTPFAVVAQSTSTDATSAADGGAIGCFAPTDPAYASVTSDTTGLAVGVVSQPKDDSGNYILLEITARRPTSFAAAGDSVRQAVLAAGSKVADRELKALTRQAHVTIDPRYGHWAGGTTVSVVPPANPPVSALLNPAG
jgi:parvulin-like peptidyl-prolyl isomerase